MTFFLGSTAINRCYIGSTEIKKAFLGSTMIFDTTAGSNIEPEARIGFGSTTTGGRGGTFYRVTSTANSGANTLRDAVSSGSRYIALCVEGEINLTSKLTITVDNLTIDGRYAPGNGCWVTGERIEVEGSNIIFDDFMHLGNDTSVGGDSDNMRVGIFESGGAGGSDIDRIYLRRCAFLHGRDECLAFTPRANGDTVGNDVNDVTVEKCIVGLASEASHEYGLFVGDGVDSVTLTRNMYHTLALRVPFVREFATKIEQINDFIYNCTGDDLVNDSDELHVIKTSFKKGPITPATYDCINNKGGATLYETGCVVSGTGTNTIRGGGGTYSGSTLFTGSGITEIAGSAVEAAVLADVGPRNYADARNSLIQGMIDDATAGDAPTALESHPGTLPTDTSTAYESINANGVPNAYLTDYPSDTDPETTISDGSSWDGYMVAERIGAWHVAPAGAGGSYSFVAEMPFSASSSAVTTTVSSGLQTGDIAIIVLESRGTDSDPVLDTGASTYAGTAPTDLGVVKPVATSGVVKMRIYAYEVVAGDSSITFAGTDVGANAISGSIHRGVDIPTGLLGSTDGTDQSGTAISVSGGTVTNGSEILAIMISGADQTGDVISAFSGTNIGTMTMRQSDQSDVNAGFGIYQATGTASSTSVGPVTGTASVSDAWQAALVELALS